jgi:membrane protein
MNFKNIFELVRDTFKDWSEDKAARLGAALAYYTIFSIGPLLVIAIAIASLVFGDVAARGQIVGTIGGMVGEDGGKLIEDSIENANQGGGNIIATAIGIGTLLFGAAGVFGQLKDALNTIWEVKPKPNLGFMHTIKERFFSFTMVLGTGFLLLVSLVISAAVAALGKFLSNHLPGADIIWQVVNFLVALAVITLMFALLFKFLPDVKIGWKDVWIGALVSALLFLVGQFLLGFYLGSGAVGSAWGAAGALVIILVWVYYSAQIFFLGAEFTQVYTNKFGSRVRPEPYAEFVTEDARAQQGMEPKEGDDTKKRARRGPQKLKPSPWFK